ncbi:hypothetical protein [Mycobacterium sp. ITM-2016-00318]|uniref:hypothetical protein n=1 Tax=Mycobacterium sp. ITM-2016-00318 TaxID=2099693 RepID=UPI000CF9309B|nr:hypothetical protein [Mycobacterium sp. ITM-2016-00318]WNG93712.1 hypothetical protein C6A82_004395 [Mycobacterium sp. ITM-2016-00318]
MPTLAGTGFPTLSQVVDWDVGHLHQAASEWTRSANQWEDHFDTLHRRTVSPGDTVWEGRAAEVAQHRTYADLVKVRGAADNLRNAAAVASRGADELLHARFNVLNAVAAAEKVGLVVGEDLSVTVALTNGSAVEQSRQLASARQRADEIAVRVIELSAVDKRIADAITTATVPLTEVQFTESPVQLVDNRTFKEGPPIPVPGTPDDPVGRTGGPNAGEIRSVIMSLPEGTRPDIREIRTAQDLQNLWGWMRQDAVEIPNAYGDPAKGIWVATPDGTQVGQRFAAESTKQAALDIKIPGERDDYKVHINPRGGVPEIPSIVRPPSMEAPPRLPEPIETPQMRGGGLVVGVMPDGILPHLVHPPEAGDPDLPVIGDGIPDHPNQ